jgi:hypothetical protein
MSWQERLRDLGEQLTEGQITTDDYRRLSEEILAEADAEAAAETQPTETQPPGEKPKVHIPVSAAWEAPSGEMTQIVGTQDKTTVVNTSIADKLEPDDPAT